MLNVTASARRIRYTLRRLLGSERDACAGSASVELGVLAPLLALTLISAADLGFGIYRYMQVQKAAQAGAEYAIARGYSPSAIQSAITSATSLSGVDPTPAPAQFCGCPSAAGVAAADCGSTCPGAGKPGTYVTVSAQSSYTTIIPYPTFPETFVFSAQSTVRIR